MSFRFSYDFLWIERNSFSCHSDDEEPEEDEDEEEDDDDDDEDVEEEEEEEEEEEGEGEEEKSELNQVWSNRQFFLFEAQFKSTLQNRKHKWEQSKCVSVCIVLNTAFSASYSRRLVFPELSISRQTPATRRKEKLPHPAAGPSFQLVTFTVF